MQGKQSRQLLPLGQSEAPSGKWNYRQYDSNKGFSVGIWIHTHVGGAGGAEVPKAEEGGSEE